ncbi:MBG domain-containing protein [Pedobacter agri]|uniref:MBG domain-containing protein n=1 Tax=Pedobacter agri TaxID=454586 RepID=UPI00292FB6F1|nr:MBG domain-containing protein [Pedobacter agri]
MGTYSVRAQTTETFESTPANATSFTSNGQVFNITTNMPEMPWAVFDIFSSSSNFGWNGTAKDSRFIDNSGGGFSTPNTRTGVNVNFSISTQAAAPFQVKSLWIYTGRAVNANLTSAGSLTFTGSLNGVTKFTATSSSGFNTNVNVANGYTFIDFTGYGGGNNTSINIDKLTISTTGEFEYIGLDAFRWSIGSVSAAPVLTTTTGSTAFLGSPIAVDNGLTVSDSDNTTLASATVTITGNLQTAEDVLAFNNTNNTTYGNIIGNYTAGSGALTLTSAGTTATLAQWQAALRTVTYTNAASSANTANRTITFRVNDGTSNSNTATKSLTVANPATVNSIARAGTNPTNSSTVQYTLTFNKSVTGITPGNFSVTTTGSLSGIAIASISGSGSIYTVTVNTGTGSGNLTLNLANATGLTPSISTSLPFSGETYSIDKSAPLVIVSSTAGPSGGSTGTSPIPFSVTFSESVTGFVAGDITPGNATISGFSGSGTTYTFNATPTANGAVTVNIAANVAVDAAGNGNTAASQFAITYAQALTATPVVTSPANGSLTTTTSPNYTGSATAGATVTVYVDGTTLGTTTATGGNWSLTQPAALTQGSHTVYATAQVTGNAVSANSTTNTFTVDSTRPSVVISSSAGTSGGSTNTSPVPFTVTFSESVTGFVAGDITPGNATISGFSGNGTTYTFNATPTANGVVTMNVAANVAQDVAGNGNTAASQFAITYAQAVTATPVVISPTSSILITTTTPTYEGTATAGATVTVYVDGASVGTTTATGGNWSLTQPAALTQGSHTVYATAQVTGNAVSANSTTNTFTVDSTRPSVVISSTAGASGGSTGTSPVPFTVTFSESVTGFVAGDITPGNATISGFSGSGTTYTFNATPTANGAVTVNIAANVAVDAAGNGNTAASQFAITYAQAFTATPVVTSPANGSLTTTTTPNYTGSATAGATVTVYLDGASVGSTTATGGNWSLTQPTVLTQGSHTVYATAQVTGNAVSANSTTNTFTVDSTKPSVVISSTASPTGGSTGTSPVPFTVTFSESVTGFVAGDITPGNAIISGFSGSGTTYTFNATPTTNGSVTVNIAANVAVDAAGNGNTAASQFAITYSQASQITASAGTFPLALSTTYGTTSTSTSVTVSGTGLSAGITATPSSTSNFEVSADNVSYRSSVTIGNSGTVAGTLYVRLKANAPAGTNITGNVVLTSNGANSPTVSIPSSIVAKATLTYTSSPISKVYGDAVPTLSGSVKGFVNAENLGATTTGNITWSTTATATSPVGSYAITGTGLSAANYDFVQATPNATALTINAKTIMVTAVAKSKTYGDVDPALTYTFAPALAVTDTFSGSLTRTPGENMGTYAINQGTLALSGNYTVTYVGADLTIGAKTITVTAAAKSKTYGDADPALTYTFAPALAGTDTFSGSLTRTLGENVGTYAINQGTLALSSNYTITYVGADLTIGAKAITVTAAAKSKTYGDADPALTYTFTPVLLGTDTFTGSLTRAPGENVGTYAINQGTLALNSNYTVTYVGADLTIGTKAITVTAEAKSKIYVDADPALTYTFTPVLLGTDTFTGSLTRAPGENVGTYAINQGTLALNSNYTVTYVGADLTIGAKAITVTAASKSKTYGDADPALTYTFAPALAGTDTFSGSLMRITGQNVGTYAINQGTLALSGNYTVTYVGADLTIGTKTITVTAAAKSKTYGDADPSLTYTFAPALLTGDSFSGSLTRTPGENLGTYAINQGTLALNGNYTLTYIGSDLTIGAKTVTVTAAAKSKTYGDADPALTYTFAPALLTGDSFSGSLTRTPGENVGTYVINQGTLALNSNYTLKFVSANLTVNAKTITVTAAAKSKTYGDADPALTYTFAPALLGTDTFTGSLTRSPGENVDTYAINQGTLALNSNYTLTFVSANLGINAKSITVTAAAKSKTYGNADPALTYTFAPVLVTGDSFSGSLTRTPGENVGTYAINQGTLALSSNYTVTYVGADLTIGAKAITVTAAAKNKTYGDVDPALTYTFAPALAGADTFIGSLTRTPGENVGTYAINQGTLALNSNYTVTYVGADLTIGAKAITVTAASKSKTYGDADPALTYTFAPALAGTDTFSGSLTRTPGENVGTYAINQGTLALNSNYTVTYVGVDLTIGAKTITVTAAAKSKTYGNADPALTYTFAPALAGTDTFSGSLTRTSGENVGTYAINQGTLALNSNYSLTYIGADLTIGAKTVTVTAAAKSKTYGDADPALTYTFAPALTGTDTYTGSLTRSPGENTGTYAINQGTLALNSNYTLTYIGADLTIGAKTVTVTAAAKSKTFGDADPALTYTFAPALNGTDIFTGSLTRSPGENVGTYAINSGTLALSSNYALTYVGANLTIGAKTVTVTAAAKSKIFGDADPALTYTFSPTLLTGDTFTGSLTRLPGENTGTYAINQGTLALNSNYSLTYIGANLSIGAKTITVTAAAKSKTYGDVDPALTYTFAPALGGTDTFTGSLTRLPGENVGTYAINRGTLALSSNYALTYIGADLTIGAKIITVTAAAKSKTYGDVDAALTYTFASALAGTDTFTGSLTRLPGENVGTYAINRGTLALSSNYALTYIGADLTIGAKIITVTAASKSKTFGDADPAPTYTFAPILATGDTFTGSLARVPGENVGTYAINRGTLSLSNNYAMTYVGADLTIAAKTITVAAAAKSKTFGDADPALTYTFAPALATGDTFSGSLVRVSGENVGIYVINRGTLSLSNNYAMTYVGADLTIAAKTITVTVAAKGKTYGDADPVLTYTVNPALPPGTTVTGSLTRAAGENAGTYEINQGSLTLGSNYVLTYVGADLTINKALLTVSATNALMCQSDGFPNFGVAYSGFKAGDTENSLSTKATVGTAANRNVAGTYALVPSNGLSGNYTFVYVNGSLIINAIPSVNIVSNKGTEVSKGETAVLTASGGIAYSWSSTNVIISGQNTATITIRPAQTTTYTVRVTNASGCNSSESLTVKVAEDYKLIANNILTPNGDGVNDTWTVQNIDMYPSNEVRIFDRNGREMYSKKSYDNSWNGTIGGNDLAEGTYYYIITYGPNKLVQKGFITIIRNR